MPEVGETYLGTNEKNIYMVDETIFRCIMFCFKCPEKCLFRSQNLHRTSRVFCQANQASSMANQPGTNQLSNESRQIWSNGVHTVTEVFCELRPVG